MKRKNQEKYCCQRRSGGEKYRGLERGEANKIEDYASGERAGRKLEQDAGKERAARNTVRTTRMREGVNTQGSGEGEREKSLVKSERTGRERGRGKFRVERDVRLSGVTVNEARRAETSEA